MTNSNDVFSLKWNNYFSNFVQLFNEQMQRHELVDVTLSCQGKFLKAHKLILSSCSEFFRELFANCPSQNPVIVLHKVSLKDLKNLLRFMYYGEITVVATDIESLVELGTSFRVKGLCAVKMGNSNDTAPANSSQPTSVVKTTKETSIEASNKRNTARKKSCDTGAGTKLIDKPANVPDLPKNKKQKNVKISNETPKVADIEESLRCDDKMLTDSNSDLDSASEASLETVDLAAKIGTQDGQSKPPDPLGNEITDLNNEKENISDVNSGHISPRTSSAVLNTGHSNVSCSLVKSNLENGVSKRRLDNEEEGDSSKTSKSNKQIKIAHVESISGPGSTITTTTTSITGTSTITRTSTSTSPSTSFSSSSPPVPSVQMPKTPNAFMIFADEWRKKISTEHPDEDKKGISIKLSEMWRSLSPESKEMYYARAREAEHKHNLKFSIRGREKPRPKRRADSDDGPSAIHHPEIHLKDEYVNDDDIMEIIDC